MNRARIMAGTRPAASPFNLSTPATMPTLQLPLPQAVAWHRAVSTVLCAALLTLAAAAMHSPAQAAPPADHATVLAQAAATPPGTEEHRRAPPAVTWQHQGSHSYEAERPGLGVSDRYASPIGWADVYVYGLKRNDWRTGVDDPQFGAHFNTTVDEVKHYGRVGAYAELQIGEPRDVTVAGHVFRTISFRFVRDGRAMASTTYLTGRGGKLLKYRISIDANAPQALDATAQMFIEEHLRSTEPAGTVRDKGVKI